MIIVLHPKYLRIPDFKVSTVYYQVENGHNRDGLGSEENYFWKTAKERSDFNDIGCWKQMLEYCTDQYNTYDLWFLGLKTNTYSV